MLHRIIWFLTGVLVLTTSVLAQSYKVTKPKILEKESTAMEWLYAGTFLVGCMVIAFKPAKRSNLR